MATTIPPWVPLPYGTPEELQAAFDAGTLFLFVRVSERTVHPVHTMYVNYSVTGTVRALDSLSQSGGNFKANGRLSASYYLVLATEAPLPTWMTEDNDE